MKFSSSQGTEKCCRCSELIYVDKKIFFSHGKIPNKPACNAKYCIWCCYDKITKYYHDSLYLNCCDTRFPGTFDQMSKFVEQNCIICGKNCKSQKVKIYQNGKLHAGKECYLKLHDSSSWYLQQNPILKRINQKVTLSCCSCNQMKFNIFFTKTKQEVDFRCCIDCLKKSYQESLKIKFCQNKDCNQPQIIEKHENIFGFFGKKLLYIRKFKVGSSDKKSYCSFCIYQQYMKFQIENQKFQQALQKYKQIKESYQKYFQKYCMVCGQDTSSKVHIIKIKIKSRTSILTFICQKCKDNLVKNQRQYICLPKVKRFIKQYQLQSLLQKPCIEKKQFQKQVKKCSDQLKKMRQKDNNYKQDPVFNRSQDGKYYNEPEENDKNLKKIYIQRQQRKRQFNFDLTEKLIQSYPKPQERFNETSYYFDQKKFISFLVQKAKIFDSEEFIQQLNFNLKYLTQVLETIQQQPIQKEFKGTKIKMYDSKYCSICKNRQKLLNLDRGLCDRCFFEYLLRDQKKEQCHNISSKGGKITRQVDNLHNVD